VPTPPIIIIIISVDFRLEVHTDAIIDARAQKTASHTVAQFAHDHGEEQNTIITTTVLSFTRAQKTDSHTVVHYRIGVCTRPTNTEGSKAF